MKKGTFVKVLIDSSGSMLSARSATIIGYNNYVDTLDKDAVVSVAIFAAPYGLRRIHTNVDPATAKIREADYPCIGGTPLYDAIGSSIQEIDTEAREFDRVVFVIQTDGQETGESREFTAAIIKQLLTDKQDGEGWLVVFLGAGINSMQEATRMGVHAGHTAHYSLGASGQAFSNVARSTASYTTADSAAVGRMQAEFSESERASMQSEKESKKDK